jgi:long-chain fatty acid transport protein
VLADLDGSGVPGDRPGEAFLGMEMEDVSDIAFGLRLGFQYTRGAMTLGGAYFTKTDLNFDGGTATMNLAALGLGRVDYDCKMSNFAWPQQAGLGLAYEVNPSLLIAGDLDWVDWSGAVDTLTITADNPDLPVAPPAREIPFPMNWEDQWVWALGMELKPAERWAVRLGYNHGDTPIPEASLRPHFPAIAEDHITGGAGFSKGSWIFDVGVEYALESQKTNNSLDPAVNPFGPGSQETLSQLIAHFTVRTVFSRGAQP